jgi:hypothetical protein
MTKILVSLTLATLASSANAFVPSASNHVQTSTTLYATESAVTESRRSILIKGVASAFLAFGTSQQPVFAEVAKGDSLPDGAAQFKRLLSLKSDLPAVIKRVTEGGAEGSETPIDKKEWDALSDFMRKVYKGGDDMKAYIKGGAFYDPEKKKKAEEDYKLLQKIAQAGDAPISKEDAQGLAGVLRKADAVLDDFFELLRDVPDEI